jgi:zinc D-Ala-D-Ala carboxypeptidase
MTDYPLTRDFRVGEFDCQHCGARGIQQSFVEELQGLRDAIGKPLVVNSGYRCSKHPLEAKKAKPGRHTEGIAADIRPIGASLFDLYRLVLKEFPAFHGIGVAPHQGYIHLDARPIPAGQRAVVWAYDRSGAQVKWDGRWENLPQ